MNKEKDHKIISKVEPGSLAEEGDIRPGDRLLKVNGFKIKDYFDYKFLTSDTCVTLELEDPEGEKYQVDFEKEEYEDLGIEFKNTLMDEDRGCRNKCVFCFIDQLPPGMRETVYFKDDDTRLSFLTGNYVTLTNVDYKELDRIVRYRMSPINVSVHTTNPELRVKMLRNRFAGDIMEKLRVLQRGCITVNAQIVLCPDINDKEELVRTVSDLKELDDTIVSVSVVPVGLTKHREGLAKLRLFTPEESAEVVDFVESVQKEMYKKTGRRFLYAADEFYINCGRKMPDYDDYDGFPQLENGVGMCALLEHEVVTYITEHKKDIRKELSAKYTANKADDNADGIQRKISLATGFAAYDIIKGLAEYAAREFSDCFKMSLNTYKIRNDFFGDSVTVSGLLTGRDILAQLKDKDLGEELLVTENMLRAGENVMLDDMTTDTLGEELNVHVRPVGKTGEEFVRNVLGLDI